MAREEDATLPELENLLDVEYYTRLVEGVKARDQPTQAFLNFLEREVDIVNLKLILRAKHAGVDEYQIVPGGASIHDDLARRLRGAEWSEVATLLEETPYGKVLRRALTVYQEEKDLNALASALDEYHLSQAADFGHRYPLSILPIIDYVLGKRREVDRIRMIAHAKHAEMTREEIEALVNP